MKKTYIQPGIEINILDITILQSLTASVRLDNALILPGGGDGPGPDDEGDEGDVNESLLWDKL